MNLEIRIIGDPILRKKAKEVVIFDENFKTIITDFFEKMYKWDGVGLAAPQAGISLRFFVMDDGEENGKKAVINPEILGFLGEDIDFEEGCLSIPNVYAHVIRKEGIKVRYQDVEGNVVEEELHGYTARVFQHETDHLNGILFTDRLSVVQKAKLKKELLRLGKEGKKKAKELGEVKL
ncbi:peptide deformylase [Tepiditoga spiralis]|uniref:Peptide deformylase n=1 Tax=Tepiditoga spiralis TaxID=2108365 RepID=A0A7G1G168_9BACT|nr:peptide deformylase [Tepiditoga spiralis]BBE29870.1 peptide deformylase [Tepiditoga spiralis]